MNAEIFVKSRAVKDGGILSASPSDGRGHGGRHGGTGTGWVGPQPGSSGGQIVWVSCKSSGIVVTLDTMLPRQKRTMPCSSVSTDRHDRETLNGLW